MKVPQPTLQGSGVFSKEAWQEICRSLRLSRKELQMVQGVFDDRSELAMSQQLGIPARTFHTHMQRLHRKLAVKDRGELLLRIMCEFLRLTTTPQSGLPPICARYTAGQCPVRD